MAGDVDDRKRRFSWDLHLEAGLATALEMAESMMREK